MLKYLYILAISHFLLSCQTLSPSLEETQSRVNALEVPPAKFARGFHGTCATSSSVYIFGGMSDESSSLPPVVSDGWRFDFRQGTWVPLIADGQPSPRFAHAMAANERWLFIWGGQGNGSSILHDGALYDQQSRRWLPLPAPPAEGRRYAEAVWSGKEFLVIGGHGNGHDLNTILSFDPESMSWKVHSKLPDGSRWGHSVTVHNGQVLVWGGASSEGLKEQGWTLKPGSPIWESMSKEGQPTPRSNHTATNFDGQLVVWGGHDGSLRRNDGGTYDPLAKTWKRWSLPALKGRSGHGMSANQKGVLIWGGRDSKNEFLSDGAFINIKDGTWKPFAPSTLDPRSLHGLVTLQDRFLLIGGFGPAEMFKLHYFGDAYWLNPDSGATIRTLDE